MERRGLRVSETDANTRSAPHTEKVACCRGSGGHGRSSLTSARLSRRQVAGQQRSWQVVASATDEVLRITQAWCMDDGRVPPDRTAALSVFVVKANYG